MKSEPFKLTKITALVAVPRSYGWFLYVVVTSTFYCPLSPQLWWLPSKFPVVYFEKNNHFCNDLNRSNLTVISEINPDHNK
ncbi:hypothetical protein HanRHA438_Chr12g0542211 [Helianthus annuus]|nr:hypothetical protein HanRHA438_Chr12g0542211 [Helianthus annuus]